jgi:hypothetical protein
MSNKENTNPNPNTVTPLTWEMMTPEQREFYGPKQPRPRNRVPGDIMGLWADPLDWATRFGNDLDDSPPW